MIPAHGIVLRKEAAVARLRLTVEIPESQDAERVTSELVQAALTRHGIVVLTSMLYTMELDVVNVENVADVDDGIQQ